MKVPVAIAIPVRTTHGRMLTTRAVIDTETNNGVLRLRHRDGMEHIDINLKNHTTESSLILVTDSAPHPLQQVFALVRQALPEATRAEQERLQRLKKAISKKGKKGEKG